MLALLAVAQILVAHASQALQFCPHDGSPTHEVQDTPKKQEDPMIGRVVR